MNAPYIEAAQRQAVAHDPTPPLELSNEEGARVVVALMPRCVNPEGLAMVLTRNADNIEDVWWIV